MKNRSYAAPLGAAIIVVVIGIGFVIASRVHADSPAKGGSAARAAIAIVSRGNISNSVSVAGEFSPYQEVELHAKVAGYIRKINVDIGDHVHTGQVLALLEVPELTAQVEGADASVRHSQDEIVRAQNEVSRAEADHAALHAADERLKQASAARPGLIAAQELDNAEARDRAAEAQIEASKSAYSASKQQLDVSKATHSQVSAMSDYARIVAPFDGVVTWRYADTGALVQAGTSSSSAQPVVKLAEVNMLRLRIAVPETFAASVHTGEPADITVQATGETFTGKVSRSTDALDRSTRTEQVEIDVPNKDQHLAPGMYADVVLKTQQRANVLLVPVQAVIHGDTKSTILVVGNDNRVSAREVRTGLEDGSSVEVISGLKQGERIIAANTSAYQEGETVDPKLTSMTTMKDEAK